MYTLRLQTISNIAYAQTRSGSEEMEETLATGRATKLGLTALVLIVFLAGGIFYLKHRSSVHAEETRQQDVPTRALRIG